MDHSQVLSGLDRIITEKAWQQRFSGNIAYLCHSASVDRHLKHGLHSMLKIFGERLVKVFSPQHGFASDVQDNMVESDHYLHPYFQRKIYSLYSETRIPTDEMLEGIDHLVIDLQDVGTRIYTYIYTMTHTMEACAKKGIEVVVLDRPNPIGGLQLEGTTLDLEFSSFVGRHPLPVRHGLTIAEVALMAQKKWGIECNLTVVPMLGWKRSMLFEDTKLPWVIPSPNLPTIDGAFCFVGTVLYEGTNISEGRGTTRSLEIIGHPKIEPFSLHDTLMDELSQHNLAEGFVLRPLVFLPTFQKHAGTPCGGYQIHITDRQKFRPWIVAQSFMKTLFHQLGDQFAWKQPPYEYEYEKLPIDLINGGDRIRKWITQNESLSELLKLEQKDVTDFAQQRQDILIGDYGS